MQLPNLKNHFFAVILVATSLSSATLTGCSTTTSQNPVSDATNTSDNQSMHHGGMNHNMNMDLGTADANYDLRFIDAMIPHHQGAVEMAKQAQQKSKRPEIQKLAANIIKSQNQEINQMKQWRKAWYPKAGAKPVAYDAEQNKTVAMSSAQKQDMMMSMNLGTADKQFDLRFINAMIPHHEAAVTMGEDVLQKSQRPQIKNLAENIVKAQESEINQMKKWRQAWYNK
jgi:uncharacterized protein (DUF305 family)